MKDYDSDKVSLIMRTGEYRDELMQALIDGMSSVDLISEILDAVKIAAEYGNFPEIAMLANSHQLEEASSMNQVDFADQAIENGEDLTVIT